MTSEVSVEPKTLKVLAEGFLDLVSDHLDPDQVFDNNTLIRWVQKNLTPHETFDARELSGPARTAGSWRTDAMGTDEHADEHATERWGAAVWLRRPPAHYALARRMDELRREGWEFNVISFHGGGLASLMIPKDVVVTAEPWFTDTAQYAEVTAHINAFLDRIAEQIDEMKARSQVEVRNIDTTRAREDAIACVKRADRQLRERVFADILADARARVDGDPGADPPRCGTMFSNGDRCYLKLGHPGPHVTLNEPLNIPPIAATLAAGEEIRACVFGPDAEQIFKPAAGGFTAGELYGLATAISYAPPKAVDAIRAALLAAASPATVLVEKADIRAWLAIRDALTPPAKRKEN